MESIGNIRIAYLFVDSPDLLPEIETALIEWFDPPLNVVGKKPKIAENNDPEKYQDKPKYVDLSGYWTEDKNISIQKAKEMTGLDKRTLSSAKKGQLDRGHFETLFKLRDLASELAGKPLTLEEIFSK
ncbi:hypothetical protein [Anabaena sp. UHCC 0451]|uniref:hypothetical protein n=1 Tax=Anabaena sp. UHCC 0451 TaxID=2055235 RepID=UPI002B21D16D|nr:hypothetical protein [Anabaena sp. UHCC 0451]MEA5578708.1 hypothetical protein [Anabaena sp. UHCC 0451]